MWVDIQGVNNDYAGAWVVLHGGRTGFNVPVSPNATAVATVTFRNEPETGDPGALEIIKLSNETNNGLAGAVFRITGSNGN